MDWFDVQPSFAAEIIALTGRSAKSSEYTARVLQRGGNELAVSPATTCLLMIITEVRSGLVYWWNWGYGLILATTCQWLRNVAVAFEPTSVVILHMFLMIRAALCYPRFIAAVQEGIARRGNNLTPMFLAEWNTVATAKQMDDATGLGFAYKPP